MFNLTIEELENYSDIVEFERFCCDILSRLGYRGIDPQGVGRKDGGKDAILIRNESEKIVFHFSLRKDWETKLKEDLEKVKKGGKKYTDFIFVSSQRISPQKKDTLKEFVINQYKWNLDIFDNERLRVELDNHSKDLRLKYFNIKVDYNSYIEEKIADFIDKWADDYISYLLKERYNRFLLLAIPNSKNDNLMGLFDETSKFIGDQSKLNEILKEGLFLVEDCKFRIRSDSYSIFSEEQQDKTPIFHYEPIINESNIYNNGILEILTDITFNTFKIEFFKEIIGKFFTILSEIYSDKLKDKDYLTICVILINADKINIETNDEKVYCGENFIFKEFSEGTFEDIKTKNFQERFIEMVINKIKNFFNILSKDE